MGVKPLGDRVLVSPLEAEEKTKGGIVLPDTAKEKPQQGKHTHSFFPSSLHTPEESLLQPIVIIVKSTYDQLLIV